MLDFFFGKEQMFKFTKCKHKKKFARTTLVVLLQGPYLGVPPHPYHPNHEVLIPFYNSIILSMKF